MEVLLEYRGSRRQITVAGGESIIDCVAAELRRVGRSGATVYTAQHSLRSADQSQAFILQKWSPQWDCYVDIRNCSEIQDGDKLSVSAAPKPPSKVSVII